MGGAGAFDERGDLSVGAKHGVYSRSRHDAGSFMSGEVRLREQGVPRCWYQTQRPASRMPTWSR